jgi:Ca2+-binding EF-hand superfamily protein
MDANKRPAASEAIKHPWFKQWLYRHEISTEKINEYYQNIISFKIDSKFFFQQATLAYMVHHLTKKEDLDDIRKFYQFLDKNGDGKMAYSEIVEGFKEVMSAVNEKELMKVFKYIDQAKTGCIEYEGKCSNYI